MTFTLDPADARTMKAVEIAAGAGSWLRVRGKDGRSGFGIPSACEPGRWYMVTAESCDCQDAKRRPGLACKHQCAVRLHVTLVEAVQPKRRPTMRIVKTTRVSDEEAAAVFGKL